MRWVVVSASHILVCGGRRAFYAKTVPKISNEIRRHMPHAISLLIPMQAEPWRMERFADSATFTYSRRDPCWKDTTSNVVSQATSHL